MKTRIPFFIAFLTLLPALNAQQVVYVRRNGGSDTFTGLSWAQAKRTVQAAINLSTGEVWVAKGTNGLGMTVSYVEGIQLKPGIGLYGGFAGTETSRSQRNPVANITVLDANLTNRVVDMLAPSNATQKSVIDGFTIVRGIGQGAGVRARASGQTVFNCRFLTNASSSSGGAIWVSGGSPFLISNAFFANTAALDGGAVYCEGTPTLLNNLFVANVAQGNGGALSVGAGVVANNVIVSNRAATSGGAIHNYASAHLVNNTIVGNIAQYSFGGAIHLEQTASRVGNNIVAFNSGGLRGVGGLPLLRTNCVFGNTNFNYSGSFSSAGNFSANPLLANPAGGNFHLLSNSPCVDKGTLSWVLSGWRDLDDGARIMGGRVDIGADEWTAAPVTNLNFAYYQNYGLLTSLYVADVWDLAGEITWTTRGQLNGLGDQIVSQGRFMGSEGELHAYADSSPVGASVHLVEAYRDGRLVESALVPEVRPLFRLIEPRAEQGIIALGLHGPALGRRHGAIEFGWPQPDGSGPLVLGAGSGLPIPGTDLVRVTPVPADLMEVDPPFSAELTGMPGLFMEDLAHLFTGDNEKQGRPHRALGAAMLQSQATGLAVSNIGASGEDGVAMDVGDPGTGIIVLTEPILLSHGLDLTLSAVGTLNGIPDSSFGAGRVAVNGSPVLSADFSGIGSPNVTAEIFNGSMRVGGATFAANAPLTMSALPMGIIPPLEAVGVVPPCLLPEYDGFEQTATEPLPCYFFGFGGLATFTAPGGEQFTGNRVRFLASGQSRIQSLARFDIRGVVPAGMITIAREKIRVAAPEVAAFFPSSGKPGDLITIYGRGFGNDADDLAVVSAAANATGPWQAPFHVLSATDTRLTVRVGEFAPNAMPGPILVARGAGRTGRVPLDGDVDFGQPPRQWQGGGSPGGSGSPFNPESFSSGPCIVSSAPTGGKLEIYFTGAWPADVTAVGVTVHARNQTTGNWLHLYAPQILLPTGCDTLGCAQAIADAMDDLTGATADFTAEPAAFGQVRLKVEIPGGYVDMGLLSVCRNVPPDDPDPDFDYYNQLGSPDTIPPLEIVGSNFGFDPDALSVSAEDGASGRLLPLRAKSASDTHVTACLGALPPGAQLGPLQIARGEGVRTRCAPSFPDMRLLQDVWVWHGMDPAVAGPNLPPPPVTPPAGPTWIYSLPPANGVLYVTLADSWPSNALVSIALRAEDSTNDVGSFELDAPALQLGGDGSSLDCAERVADLIRSAFRQQAGLEMGVRVDPAPGGGRGFRVTLFIPGGYIDRGFLTVGVAAPAPALIITDTLPRTGGTGDRVVITGQGFGTDPDDLVVFVDGGTNAPTMLHVIAVTDSQIVARIGTVRPDAGPGAIVVSRGVGGPVAASLPGASLFNSALGWNGLGNSASSPNLFNILHETNTCFHSLRQVTGETTVSLVLTGDWAPYSKVTVEAFLNPIPYPAGPDPWHQVITREFQVPGEAGSAYSCASLVCDFVEQMYIAYGPWWGAPFPRVYCNIIPMGSDAYELTFRGPIVLQGGQYVQAPIYGFVNVCVEPPVASGVAHLAFGQTRLTLNPTGGVEAVNLGTSGEDGVRMLLGEAQGWGGEFEPFSPASGQQITATLLGARGGMMNQPLASVRVEMENNQMMLSADWSYVGSRQLMLEIRNAHGTTLTNQMLGNNEKIPVDQYFPGLCANYSVKTCTYSILTDNICVRFCKIGCECLPGTNCWTEIVACVRPSDVPDLSSLLATAVEFRSVRGFAPPGPPPPPALETLHFLHESVYVFGHVHLSRGEILMEAGTNGLTLSQFGPGALSGVTIDLAHLWPFFGNPYVQGYELSLMPLTLADGTEFRVGATGQFKSGPTTTNKFLGSAGVRKPGANVELFADFSPIGATLLTCAVHRAGMPVGSAMLPNGVVGTLMADGAGMPRLTGAARVPMTPYFLALTFDRPGNFTLGGGAPLVGDEIRFISANATGLIEWLSTLELFAGGFDEVVIVDETVLEPAISIERSGTGVRIFWPLPGTAYLLEHTATLSAPSWMSAPFPYQTNEMEISITVPMPAGHTFYRLRKP